MSLPAPRLLAAVAVGGAAGAVLRHLVEQASPQGAGGDGFPWTTLLINVIGAAALAALPLVGPIRRSPSLSVGLGTGLLGGFTTLGATSEQARALVAGGHAASAGAYLLLTLATALVAVLIVSRLVSPAIAAKFAAEEGDL